jgi:hypothetical protein
MTPITCPRQSVAIVDPLRRHPAPATDELPGGDELETFVSVLARYARDVRHGALLVILL